MNKKTVLLVILSLGLLETLNADENILTGSLFLPTVDDLLEEYGAPAPKDSGKYEAGGAPAPKGTEKYASGAPAPSGSGKYAAGGAPIPKGSGKYAAGAPIPKDTGKYASGAPAPSGSGKYAAGGAPIPKGSGKYAAGGSPAPNGSSRYAAGGAPIPKGSGKYAADDNIYSETYSESWFSRLGDSFVSVLIGFLMIFFGLPLLWFNERRAVETEKVIREGSRICRETNDVNVDSSLNGKLVHVSGKASNSKIITDEDFGISADNSAKLRRKIEVYQVKEHSSSQTKKDQIGGGQTTTTTYTYDNVWSDIKIDSYNFKNTKYQASNNNVRFICDGHIFNAEQVNIGQYRLRPSQIDRLNKYQDIVLSSGAVNNLSKRIKEEVSKLGWSSPNISVEGNYLYIRKTKGTNELGDIRISFQKVPLDYITVVALQSGNSFEPYNIKDKGLKNSAGDEEAGFFSGIGNAVDSCCWTCCCCFKCMSTLLAAPEDIDWIYEEKLTKQQVFEHEIKSNEFVTILLRILGIVLISLGIYLLFSPVIVFLSIIKIFGDAVGIAVLIVSFIIGIAVGMVVMALAWIFYRPLLALSIIAGAGLIWAFVYFGGGKTKVE